MKVPLPWEKGIMARARRALFKRALKRQMRKLTHTNRETILALMVGALAIALLVRGGGMILDKSSGAAAKRRGKKVSLETGAF